MAEIITKEMAKELMKIEGEVRGISLRGDVEFILKEKGEEGLKKLEEELEKLGFPLTYKIIKPMDFYPAGLRVITLLAMKKVFNFTDEDFRKIGIYQSKISLIIRLFMKYFVSLEALSRKVPEMWRRYYTIGDLSVSELNEKERRGKLKLERFKLHPFQCRILEGYFSTIIGMVVQAPVDCRETKCPFKGDDYHEFLAKW